MAINVTIHDVQGYALEAPGAGLPPASLCHDGARNAPPARKPPPASKQISDRKEPRMRFFTFFAQKVHKLCITARFFSYSNYGL